MNSLRKPTISLALVMALAVGQVASAQAPVPPFGASPDALAIDLIQACRTEALATIAEQTKAYAATLTPASAALKAKQVVSSQALWRISLNAEDAWQDMDGLNAGRVAAPGTAKAYYVCLDRRRREQLGASEATCALSAADVDLASLAARGSMADVALQSMTIGLKPAERAKAEAAVRTPDALWGYRATLTAFDGEMARTQLCPNLRSLFSPDLPGMRNNALQDCMKLFPRDACLKPLAPNELNGPP